MFRLEVFCEDKHLPRVLHVLAGLIHAKPEITPVANAKTKGGLPVAKTSGDLLDLLEQWIKKEKLTHITADDARRFQESIGRSPAGYSGVLIKATKAGLIKRNGKKGKLPSYQVNSMKGKAK